LLSNNANYETSYLRFYFLWLVKYVFQFSVIMKFFKRMIIQKSYFSTLPLYESYYKTHFGCYGINSILKQTSTFYFFKVGILDLDMTKMRCQNKHENKTNFYLSCFQTIYHLLPTTTKFPKCENC
jgi:hypothetical protein